ncbi:AsnC family transcriptional regulator [Amycolatopsis sp. NPDC004079]|uniref:Lrp/AsnC family transcriptional regulator n=1 Tax=Amycolatopsis sp. NPDC004079 TaxID=3154549 RepID=UPI0033BC50A3
MLTKNDLELVDALQADPRAPWSSISAAAGISAVTATRRWQRLSERRDAWFAAYPGSSLRKRMVLAFVEIDCMPGQSLAVALALADDPNVASIDHIAGRCDLLVHVLASSPHDLRSYLDSRLAGLPGVIANRALVSPCILSDGSSRRARRDGEPDWHSPVSLRFGSLDRALVHALGEDGRAPAAALAVRLNVSETTVRRRMTVLLESGALVLRCEIARSLSPAPVTATLWIQVPPDRLDSAGQSLAALPECRMCAVVNGTANLLLIASLSSEYQVIALENSLTTTRPWLRIVGRAITLRPVKLMGRLLDDDGRSVKYVPLALPR